MDYLAFGLLAGSLIVIASFVVRDGLPHLSAIGQDSRLDRLSRADTPQAWGRWCADAGLVLAGAGTVVLLITVAALLAGLSDGAGNILVGLSVAAAVVASALGVGRLVQRLRVEAEAELSGELDTVARPAVAPDTVPAWAPQPAPIVERSKDRALAAAIRSDDVWDDELPTWSPPTDRSATPETLPANARATTPVAVPVELSSPNERARTAPGAEPEPREETRGRSRRRTAAPPSEPVGGRDRDAVARPGGETRPPAAGGIFSSPLLADIGLTPVEGESVDGFQSPLLSNLHEVELDGVGEPGGGSDLLIDEAPAPVQPGGRPRDEIGNR